MLQTIEKGQNLMKKLLTGKKINLLSPKLILSPQSSLPFSQPALPKWYSFLGKCLSQGLVDSWILCRCQHTLSFIQEIFWRTEGFWCSHRNQAGSKFNVVCHWSTANGAPEYWYSVYQCVWEQMFLTAFSISLIKTKEVKSKSSSGIFGQQSLLFSPHSLLVAQ